MEQEDTKLPIVEFSISISRTKHIGPIDSPRSLQYTHSDSAIAEATDFRLGQKLFDSLSSQAISCKVKTERKKIENKQKKIAFYDGGSSFNLYEIFTAVGGIAGIIALLKAVQPSIVQWLKNRAGRSITVKAGSDSIVIKGSSDLESALAALDRIAQSRQKLRTPSSQKNSSNPSIDIPPEVPVTPEQIESDHKPQKSASKRKPAKKSDA